MGNFLNTDHLPNLNQEQIDNKNRPTIPSKIQTVIKSLLTTTKIPGSNVLAHNSSRV